MATVAELTNEIRAFADERDWSQFHTARNLVLALVGEVGELAAELQWIPDGEVHAHLSEPEPRTRFESEIADVATYLLRLCDVVGIDLASVVRLKLRLNEERYPADRARGSSAKYTNLS